MTSVEACQQLMSELGPATDSIATVVQESGGDCWAVEMEDESVVNVEFDAERERLALSTALPAPPADRKIETYEALLTYNLLWQDPPAVRMAMDCPGGDLVQAAELPTASLDLPTLQQALDRFWQTAGAWRQAIAAGCVAAPDEEATGELAAAAIRV